MALKMMGEQGVAWMKRSEIQDAPAKNPGLHPGYTCQRVSAPSCAEVWGSM